MLARLHRRQDEAIDSIPEYPVDHYSGTGIVMLAGGPYFPGACLNLAQLRHGLQCDLPVEVWYLGERDLSPQMISILEALGADCVDITAIKRRSPFAPVSAWQNKVYAIINSRFREVIYIDADNIPLLNPEHLFRSSGYQATGALFWPDIRMNDPASRIWELCRVPYQPGPEWECGQMVLDKARCWSPLWLTQHLNADAEIYFQHSLGDKILFQMAWSMLNSPSACIPDLPKERVLSWDPDQMYPGNYTAELVHLNDLGQVAFLHQTGHKFNPFGRHIPLPSQALEDLYTHVAAELRRIWDGRTEPPPAPSAETGSRQQIIDNRHFRYTRIGSESRIIELLADGSVTGAGSYEREWHYSMNRANPVLSIRGNGVNTMVLRYDPDHIWRGNWRITERLPVELIPVQSSEQFPDLIRDGGVSA